MDQLIVTFEYVRLHRKNWHGDSNISVDPLGRQVFQQYLNEISAISLFRRRLFGQRLIHRA